MNRGPSEVVSISEVRSWEGLKERKALYALVGLMGAYAAIALWLTRGVTFIHDETKIFAFNSGFDPGAFIEPHNGHLLAPLRLLYAVSIDVFGVDHLPIRVALVLSVIAAVSLMFVLLRPRIGAWGAVACCALLLFLGSSPDVVLSAVGIPAASSTAFGLAALVVLERRPPRAPAICVCLLLASVMSYSSGLAFLAAAIVWLLLDKDRVRLAWVWAIPLLAYAAWLVQAPVTTEAGFSLAHLNEAPRFSWEAMAAVLGSLSGLPELLADGVTATPAWGRVLAATFVTLVVVAAAAGGGVRLPFLAFLAIPLAYWTLIALGENLLRTPSSPRFIFVGAIGLMLVGAEAASRSKVPRMLVVALTLLAGTGLLANLLQLRDAGTRYRDASAKTRAAFAMYELAGPSADPDFSVPFLVPVPAGQYLESVSRNGSLAMSVDELERQPERIRRFADTVAVGVLRVEPVPVPRIDEEPCNRYDHAGAAASLPLPQGRAAIAATPGTLRIGRFADTPVTALNSPENGRHVLLDIPPDDDPTPWRVASTAPAPLVVCRPARP